MERWRNGYRKSHHAITPPLFAPLYSVIFEGHRSPSRPTVNLGGIHDTLNLDKFFLRVGCAPAWHPKGRRRVAR
jgi:hypothetical protein